MSETIKIKSVTDTTKKYGEKPILVVELQDGRTCKFFGEELLTAKPDQEFLVDIKEGKEYQGHKDLILNLAKQKDTKGFPQKDYRYEKRKTALECALKYTEMMVDKSKMTEGNLEKLADMFYAYLNKQ